MIAYLKVIFNLARMLTKSFFRDKVAMFFTFVFPLIFLIIFGLLNKNDSSISFDTAIINQSGSTFAKQFIEESKKSGFIKEKSVASLEEAKDKMSRSELDTILLLPPEFGQLNEKGQPTGKAVVFFDPGNQQSGQTFSSIVEGELSQINDTITGQKPLFGVEQRSIDEKSLSQFDYIFAGILGFSILSLGFFGPSSSLPSMKKQGILRRLRTTPLRVSQFILGNALNYMLIGLASTTFLFLVGVVMFDFKMQGDYLSFGIIAALGTILMFGFGLSVGGWAKNENQAAPLTNLLAFPMMFLSGIFFPRFLFPEWLQTVSGFLPITPVVDAIRFVIVEGKTIFDVGPQLALMFVWILVIYFIAFKVFRWE